MKKTELINSFIDSLKSLYDVDFFTDLIEFWQGELRILLYLDSSSESTITPSLLSDELNVARGTITASLNSLEKKGFIVRSISKEDKRRIIVTLTDEGKKLVQIRSKITVDYFSTLVGRLGEDNTEELIRLINLSINLMNNNNVNDVK